MYPAYYLADEHKNAYGGPIAKRFPYPGVVAYENGSQTEYVKTPGLYRWLKTDAWEKQSVIEAYTPEERQAIDSVSATGATGWHWLFQRLFAPSPGPAIRNLPHGGPYLLATLLCLERVLRTIRWMDTTSWFARLRNGTTGTRNIRGRFWSVPKAR